MSNITEDLKLTLDGIEFEVDDDNDLCVEIDTSNQTARYWLGRDEAQKLLDLLTRWLK